MLDFFVPFPLGGEKWKMMKDSKLSDAQKAFIPK